MPDMNQKLDRFTAKILAEAADESKRALAEVKRRRELRFQEAEDAALKEAYEYIHGEVARIQSEAGRGVSRHMLENKRALYLRRTEMAQEVFALVRAKIAAFTRTPAYGQRLTALLAEALEQLSGAEEVLVTAGRRSELSGGPGRLRAPDPPDLPGGGLPPGRPDRRVPRPGPAGGLLL